jgi:hypothetical protein
MKRTMFNIIGCFVVSYLFIYVIFFMFFAIVSVDTVIAVGILFLFFLFYFFCHKQISSYLLSQNKSIFVLFSKLIYLVLSLKMFILTLNEGYLNFLWYKFNGLKFSLEVATFVDFKLDLVKHFNINRLYNIFLIKLSFIDSLNKNTSNINIITDNNTVNLDVLLTLEFINFLKHG